MGGDRHRGRQAGADFLGKGGSGEYRRRPRAQHLQGDLVRQQSRHDLESLGCPSDARCGIQVRFDAHQRRAKRMGRHRDQRIARTGQSLPQVARHLQRIGELRVRQIALVAPRTPHRIELVAVASPQLGGMTFSGQLNGECGAPGAGADDRYRFSAWALHPLGSS